MYVYMWYDLYLIINNYCVFAVSAGSFRKRGGAALVAIIGFIQAAGVIVIEF